MESAQARAHIGARQRTLVLLRYLVEAVVAQVTHGLLDALRERLARPLDDDLQRHTEHIPVFVLAPLDPLYELGHGPET